MEILLRQLKLTQVSTNVRLLRLIDSFNSKIVWRSGIARKRNEGFKRPVLDAKAEPCHEGGKGSNRWGGASAIEINSLCQRSAITSRAIFALVARVSRSALGVIAPTGDGVRKKPPMIERRPRNHHGNTIDLCSASHRG